MNQQPPATEELANFDSHPGLVCSIQLSGLGLDALHKVLLRQPHEDLGGLSPVAYLKAVEAGTDPQRDIHYLVSCLPSILAEASETL